MFAIGDKEWPGISKLLEESGEVQQVIGKLMGTGGKLDHWDGSNLRVRLEEELGDLQAAIDFVMMMNPQLDKRVINTQAEKKLERFSNWHLRAQADR